MIKRDWTTYFEFVSYSEFKEGRGDFLCCLRIFDKLQEFIGSMSFGIYCGYFT